MKKDRTRQPPKRKIAERLKKRNVCKDKQLADFSALTVIQAEIVETLRPVRHPRVGAALGLTEEVGELARLVMEREVYGQQPADQSKLGAELADIFFLLCELADGYQIQLGTAIADKLHQIVQKLPDWREKYGPHLAKMRKRWD